MKKIGMVKKHLKEDMKEYSSMKKDDKSLMKKLSKRGKPKAK